MSRSFDRSLLCACAALPWLLATGASLGCAGSSTPVASPKVQSAKLAPSPEETRFGELRQLTFAGENAEAYFSFDGRQVSLQRRTEDIPCDRIYTMPVFDERGQPLEATAPVQISSGQGATTCSHFYPDARELLYASTHLGGAACPPKPDMSQGYVWALYDSYDIFKADADGSQTTRLTETPGYDAEGTVCARDGSVVFTSVRDGDIELYRMDRDGKNVKRLTFEPGYDGGAFFNADCSKIVWRASRPKPGPELDNFRALLGKGLVRPTKLELFVANADGSEPRQVTYLNAASFAPFFFPGRDRIIFSSNYGDPKGREFDLWAVNADGTELERITYAPGFDGFPMFTPDGRWLIFASNRATAPGANDTNLFLTRFDSARPLAQLRPETSAAERIARDAAWLADPAREGRGIGTAGLTAAGEYIETRLRELGLAPLADAGGYRGNFEVVTELKRAPETQLKVADAVVAAEQYAPLGYSAEAKLSGEAVLVGHAISDAQLGIDDFKGRDVKNKIVIARRFAPDHPALGTPAEQRRAGDLRKKAFQAKAHGARALIVIDMPAAPTGFPAAAAASGSPAAASGGTRAAATAPASAAAGDRLPAPASGSARAQDAAVAPAAGDQRAASAAHAHTVAAHAYPPGAHAHAAAADVHPHGAAHAAAAPAAASAAHAAPAATHGQHAAPTVGSAAHAHAAAGAAHAHAAAPDVHPHSATASPGAAHARAAAPDVHPHGAAAAPGAAHAHAAPAAAGDVHAHGTPSAAAAAHVQAAPAAAQSGAGAELPAEAALPELRPEGTGDAGIPVIVVKREALARVWSRLESGKSVPVSLQVAFTRTRAPAFNVIGRIRAGDGQTQGENAPLIVGAHYDHLGYGGPGSLAPDSHVPHLGADDNASGVATLLEIARDLSARRHELKHDVVIAAFSGEESGVLGSAALVTGKPSWLGASRAMLNLDMVGRLRGNTLTVLGSQTASEWPELIERVCSAARVQCNSSGDGYGPSDQISFYTAGLPVLHLFTGAHADYHKPSDTAVQLNAAGMAQIALVAAGLIKATDESALHYQKVAAPPAPGDARSWNASLGTIPDYAGPPQGVKGVLLADVRPGGGAALAGMRRGDVITRLGRFEVGSVEDLMFVLMQAKPGESVTAVVVREGNALSLPVTFQEGRRR